MLSFDFDKWTIRSDPDLTREVYASIDTSGAELCGCEECFNFAAVRHLVYTPEILNLLDWFGVDPLLESGVRHRGRLDSGLHLYSGWFHLVGEITAGPLTPVAASREGEGEESIVSLIPSGDGLQFGFSTARGNAPDEFFGLPVVQFEFCAELPWVSNGPEPA